MKAQTNESSADTGVMSQLTVRITHDQSRMLRERAKRLGLSQGDVVRLLLDAWVRHEVSVVQGDKGLR